MHHYAEVALQLQARPVGSATTPCDALIKARNGQRLLDRLSRVAIASMLVEQFMSNSLVRTVRVIHALRKECHVSCPLRAARKHCAGAMMPLDHGYLD